MMKRRDFVRNSAVVALTPTIPSFLARSVTGAEPEGDQRILVVIQLDGGNDGMNMVVPFSDEGYARNRHGLRLHKDLLKLSPDFALHPRMQGMAEMFEDGRLGIVQGVGYPNPSRSHFESMGIWHAGDVDVQKHFGAGWLGQSLGTAPGLGAAREAVFVGKRELPVALRDRRCVATSVSKLSDFELRLKGLEIYDKETDADDITSFLRRSVSQAYASTKTFEVGSKDGVPQMPYPRSQLGERLKLTSRLIKTDCRARVYYTTQEGYDTHANQLATHSSLLGDLSASLTAFMNDLRSSGLDDRVVVMAFSEFGRRVTENSSAGTDHGTAGPVLIAGAQIQAGFHGDMPSLAELSGGDLKYTVDFRCVYVSLIKNWLGLTPPKFLSEFRPCELL